MAALSADRNTLERERGFRVFNAAAAKRFYAGALVCIDANGRATPGAVAATLRGVGRCENPVDNSTGANDAVTVRAKMGTFKFDNYASDLIPASQVTQDCYVFDDHTVAATSGGGTRSIAGKVYQVDTDGVWVSFTS